MQANQRKAPRKRNIDESAVGVAASALQFGALVLLSTF